MDRALTATAASGDRPAPSAPAPTRWARRLLCGLLAVACGWSQAAAPVPFRGVDVSSLDQIEKAGAVFRSAKGAPADPLRLMKDAGVNWVRLRLWVHPVNREDVVVKGRLLSRKGEPAGGGNNDLQTTLRLAQRAHTLGLKILLDFHYSDFWADPEHQTKPAAWAELSGRELEQAVYKHTRSALQALREAGAYPNMVQIGNEIDHGMLWPDGQIDQPPSRRGEPLPATVGGFDGLAALLKAGAKAVRDTDPRQGAGGDTRIALHLASGSGLRRFFDAMRDRGVPFDVIGLSYYPQYNTSKQELSGMLSAAVARYNKPVIVMETSTGYTLPEDLTPKAMEGVKSAQRAGYPATPQGQVQLISDLSEVMNAVPQGKGLGLFWWEPAWLPLPGQGWRTGARRSTEQTLFDAQGQALPSLDAFRALVPH